MKRIILFLLFVCCFPVVVADYDRCIGPDEYEWDIEWTSGLLVVDGGGVDWLMVRNSASLEVWSTKPPLERGKGGIMDIVLTNTSRLDYFGGETEELSLFKNAEVHLYGGRIDYINSHQFLVDPFALKILPPVQHIHIYSQPGWSWILDEGLDKVGIMGLWMDGSPFSIEFINDEDYDPVWTNINVIIPEPATLLLLTLGGLLIRPKNKP